MLKLSRYIVEQDFFDNQDQRKKCIVFGTRKSALKVVDEGTWHHIKEQNFHLVPSEFLNRLQEDLILVEDGHDELDVVLQENIEFIETSDQLYLSIQPTANCPLGCGYCGQLHSPQKMSAEHQDLLIERLRKKLSKKMYRSLSIGWFGGEPISGLSVIERLSQKFVNLAEEYGLTYRAKIVTNGLLLNEQMIHSLFTDHHIREFEVTLDGTKEYHDNRRHTKAKGPTFDAIYSNVLRLSNIPGIRLTIRCNVDRTNHEGVSPLIKKLADDGLQSKVRFYVAPIHSWGNDAHTLSLEKKVFAEWEIAWLMEMQELGFQAAYLPKRKKSVCFAVNPDYELIDPQGGVYGCSEVSLVPFYEKEGKNIHEIGHVSDEASSYPQGKNVFGSFYQKEELTQFYCGTCPLLPVCGGGCPKEWKEGRIPCPPMKVNLKDKILLYYVNHRRTAKEDVSTEALLVPSFFTS